MDPLTIFQWVQTFRYQSKGLDAQKKYSQWNSFNSQENSNDREIEASDRTRRDRVVAPGPFGGPDQEAEPRVGFQQVRDNYKKLDVQKTYDRNLKLRPEQIHKSERLNLHC